MTPSALSAFVAKFYTFHLTWLKRVLPLSHQNKVWENCACAGRNCCRRSIDIFAEPGLKVEDPGKRRVRVFGCDQSLGCHFIHISHSVNQQFSCFCIRISRSAHSNSEGLAQPLEFLIQEVWAGPGNLLFLTCPQVMKEVYREKT